MSSFRIFLGVLVSILAGCASPTYKDFKTEKVKPTEGIAIGTVKIRYNGKDMSKGCAVCLTSVNGPCQSLAENGLVFLSAPKGESSLRRIVCSDVSAQHYNIQNVNFTIHDGVTYFGNVDIDWANAGGFKSSDMFGAIGAIVSESKNDGTIKVRVSDRNMKDVVEAYEQQTGQKTKPVKNLLVVPSKL